MSVTGIELNSRQDTLDEDETVVSELSNGTQLIKTERGTGIVRPTEESGRWEREYDRWDDARLYYGLLIEIGGIWSVPPESPTKNVPLKVVRAGKDAVAAYLLVGTATTYKRAYVADALDVTEQTVSNYANRIRWSPE